MIKLSSRGVLGLAVSVIVALLFFRADPISAAAAPEPRVDFWLTILHNNDSESALINLGPELEDFGGVARFKTLVDKLKRNATRNQPPKTQLGAKRGVIMVSSGDNFLAGPEFGISLDRGVPFFDTIAMDLIGYSAVAIGNHDFDFGPDVLADFIDGYHRTQPPYLSANLDFSAEPRLEALFDQGKIAKSAVVKERGELIGIIGAVTPELRFISSPRNVIVLEDLAAAVLAEVDKLESVGINKILLISHQRAIQEDLSLLSMLRGIDVMAAGGGGEVLANPGDLLVPGDTIFGPYPIFASDSTGKSIPVVTTAGNYAYVGRLVVGFDKFGNVVMVDGEKSGPMRVAGGDHPDAVEPDLQMQSLVIEPLADALQELAATVIGTSEVELDGRRPLIRTEETNEGNLVADSLRWQAAELAFIFGVSPPDVALQNGGGIRNDSIIPAGDLSVLDTFSMLPFPNFVSVVENITREQFKEILENAVSRVESVDGRFAQISGFQFEWDPTGTAQLLDSDLNVVTPGSRVLEVILENGTVIVSGGVVLAGPSLTIATIDFLARGGDQYPFRGAPFTTLGVTYQQALRNYIEDGLGGAVRASDYPSGGEGRITRLP